QSLSYSIVGGADEAKFGITSGGELTFNSAPDFEAPTDADGDNVYVVKIQASDGGGRTTEQPIHVTGGDNRLVFTSPTSANVAENSTAIMTVAASDVELTAQTSTYSIVGGADGAKFAITSDGVLTFNSAPDFELPGDANHDNVYIVTVQ